MADFILSTCSTADMPESFFVENDIKYTCFHYTMEGKEYPDDLGKTMSFKEFYEKVSAGVTSKSSQVNIEQYVALFKPYLEQGKDILHVTLSSGISGTYNSACAAKDLLCEEFPDRKIYIVDSLCASGGLGLFVKLLDDQRKMGKSIDEVLDYAEKTKSKIHHWFISTDLSAFYRGGRITKTSAAFGTLLKICPLMNVNSVGKLVIRTKNRGKQRALEAQVETMLARCEGGKDYDNYCYITNSYCEDDAKKLASMIEEKMPKLKGKIKISTIGTVIGTHTGVGTIALFFVGDEREL